jgi:uncharacterized small protein (DUF1192 family)
MIGDEDDRPRSQTGFRPADVAIMSIASLRDYVAELREEIARAEAAIEARGSSKAAADAFFKRPPG